MGKRQEPKSSVDGRRRFRVLGYIYHGMRVKNKGSLRNERLQLPTPFWRATGQRSAPATIITSRATYLVNILLHLYNTLILK